MTITEDTELDIFVASKIGSFKHIKYHTDTSKNTKKCTENLVDIKTLQKDDSITCMQWGNVDQSEILLGKKNQQIQIYSTIQGSTASHLADFAPGHIVGLGRCKRKLLAAMSSGVVKVWSKKEETVVQTGGKLDVMRVCADDATLFATGGDENDLKIWRIGESEPIFTAKNLAHDWLQLRRPVWVSGLTFLSGEVDKLAAVCSRHGYVRLYDTRAQRRPVCNVEFPGMAATCITQSFDERQVLVGFGRGQLHQVDLRVGKPDKGYKGCSGAVTDIALAKAPRLVVSTSLDRRLRVHRFDTKECIHNQYLTSKLSCLLLQTENSTPLRNGEQEIKEEGTEMEEAERGGDEEDLDVLFDNMETVGYKPRKKMQEIEDNGPTVKKIKPSTEGSTNVDFDTTEDAIVQLLRSTEKQKRRREKKRKEKKAKSIFHNA